MAWKDYAEQVSEELKVAQDTVSRLRRQLAERDEQLAIANNGGHSTWDTQVQSQVIELQKQLQEARDAKDIHAREAAQSNELFQNTLAKFNRVEKENDSEIQKLKSQLAGKNEQLRQIQTIRATDQALTDREEKLKDEVASLKSELATAKADNADLKIRCERLAKQLEVEKEENLKRIAHMKADRTKGYERDDEEPLRRSACAPIAL